MRHIIYFLLLFVLAGCATVKQPPLPTPGISREEKVVIGGLEERIFIRGRDRANPVLLFLHGGPGLPEMPFSHANAELERDFMVVHWDQRGAGKSYRPGIPTETMNTDAFVDETIALTRYLCRTLGKRKVYLAGFSWGSLVGVLAVDRAPELYHAYIGISQLVDVPRSDALLYSAAVAQAERVGRVEVARQLRVIGPPPYSTRRDKRHVKTLTKNLQPHLPLAMTTARFVRLGLQSPYYSLADDVRLIRGLQFSDAHLHDDVSAHDLAREVPTIPVPVVFLAGRHDTVLSAPLAETYFHALSAPRGKRFVWFEHSDHVLHLEERERFRTELRRIRDEVAGGDSVDTGGKVIPCLNPTQPHYQPPSSSSQKVGGSGASLTTMKTTFLPPRRTRPEGGYSLT